jgi:glycosidase
MYPVTTTGKGLGIEDRIFYHIYPLGFCGAPEKNDFASPPAGGLRAIAEHIPRLLELGINALYLGPLFESSTHGYDTRDYYQVDRRLGTKGDLQDLVRSCHEAGIAVILDAVFNHTGRDFFAFQDLRERGPDSAYRDWFASVDFSGQSPCGDPFRYEGWQGCYDLVKLNGHSGEVRDYLLEVMGFWIREFDIDGLRLDAADLLLPDFMDALYLRGNSLKEHFWLMGEVVAGDYRHWVREGRLHSLTNYELYKGLWSSFNDRNFFELAWTLNRQSGPGGLYRGLKLYNFAENHDVTRLASILKKEAHLYPLYGLLFTIPGIPSIYYGGELGLRGERAPRSDRALRPAWNFPPENRPRGDREALTRAIRNFIALRKNNPVLQRGTYRELFTAHEQFAFIRELPDPREKQDRAGSVIVAINASDREVPISIPRGKINSERNTWRDLLSQDRFHCRGEELEIPLYPSWLRILTGE